MSKKKKKQKQGNYSVSQQKMKHPSVFHSETVVRWLRFFVYCSLALFLIPLSLVLQDGIPSGHDFLIHSVYLKLFTNALALGQFPVRWIDWVYPGYNQPLFNFYQPLFYYLFQIPHALGFSNTESLKLVISGAWIASGVWMYLFVKRHFGRLAGMFGAITYLFAPYHLVDLYVRAAYPEFIALALVPALFWSITAFADTKRSWYVSLNALFFAGIITAHPPTLLLFSPLIVAYVSYLGYKNKSFITAFVIGVSFFVGIILSSFFLLPTLMEQKYIQALYLHAGYYDFHQHFVCFAQTIVPSWGYGTSVPGCSDQMSFQVGLVQWGIILATIGLGVYFWIKKQKQLLILPSIFLLAFFISLFMTDVLSKSIWETIPQFAFIQYPWRFLAVAIFSSSFLGALLLSYIPNTTYKLYTYLVCTILVLLLYTQYLHPAQYIKSSDLNFDDQGISLPAGQDLQPELGYMPKEAYVLPESGLKPSQDIKTLFGSAKIVRATVTPIKRTYAIDAKTPTRFIFFIHNFPGWKVTVDKKPMLITADNIYGFLEVSTTQGRHTITLTFTDTPIRYWGNMLTLVGFILTMVTACYSLFSFWHTKKDRT